MKIAIHKTKGSFSDRWITYCNENNISYKLVDAYDNNIIADINDCEVFLWHHHHSNHRDNLIAKQLLYSLQISGKQVFPNFNTTWFFDDKIGQKYLLEAILAPIAPTYLFFSHSDVLQHINSLEFPKVFKLKNGAGSTNVRLVNNMRSAVKLSKRMFSTGFNPYDPLIDFREALIKYQNQKFSAKGVIYKLIRLFLPDKNLKLHSREKGYLYLQDFIPKNAYDTRIIVIGNKAFGIRRYTRANDFRASGSGRISFKKEDINEELVRLAFKVNEKIKSQCIAFDFILNGSNPLILEISFGFTASAYTKCEGYWDRNLIWHQIKIDPCGWIIENIINEHEEVTH